MWAMSYGCSTITFSEVFKFVSKKFLFFQKSMFFQKFFSEVYISSDFLRKKYSKKAQGAQSATPIIYATGLSEKIKKFF